jgi:diguanylate cyclase (GGDEF)-like protein
MANRALALDGAENERFLQFSTHILDSFMPMHIWVSLDGRILHIGQTFRKFQTGKGFVGRNLFNVLVFRHPKELASMEALAAHMGSVLTAHLINGSVSGLRGNCVALPSDQGFLLNFGLGPNVHRVVSKLGLKASDFSPSDPTAELLCMTEMQSFLLNESVRLNQQLNGAKRSAEERASRDPLTGLGNRRLLADYLQRLQARPTGASFALLHIDLDKFKNVNDAFGHSAGDAVLQEAAKVLQNETRPDDVVVRLGGDEFVAVLGHVEGIEQVQALADRLIKKISSPVVFGNISCQVGASVGGVQFDGAWTLDPQYLFEEADKRLYEAKETGRGCAIVEALQKPAGHR